VLLVVVLAVVPVVMRVVVVVLLLPLVVVVVVAVVVVGIDQDVARVVSVSCRVLAVVGGGGVGSQVAAIDGPEAVNKG